MVRVVGVFVVLVAGISTALAAVPSVGSALGDGPCWRPPVVAEVIDPFREPECRWCAGNRGIEYATTPGTAVVAVATGRVTFSGTVAGREYVVVDIGGTRRVTFGGLAERRRRTGEVVRAGDVVGITAGSLHFGLRISETYVDPAPYIGRLVGRVRLLPTDGRTAPPSRPIVRCGGASADSAR
jgi:murein DD-endopeptidase MepM/ murein hydrolase activator NlpD